MELGQSGVCRRNGCANMRNSTVGTVSLGKKWEHWPCRCLRRHLIFFLSFFFNIYSILFGSCICLRLGHIMVAVLPSPLCVGSREKGRVCPWCCYPSSGSSSNFLAFRISLPRLLPQLLFLSAPHSHSEIKQEALSLCQCSAGGTRGRWALHTGFSACTAGYAMGLHETERDSHLQIGGFSLGLSTFQHR